VVKTHIHQCVFRSSKIPLTTASQNPHQSEFQKRYGFRLDEIQDHRQKLTYKLLDASTELEVLQEQPGASKDVLGGKFLGSGMEKEKEEKRELCSPREPSEEIETL
jgi:hypothetical protein